MRISLVGVVVAILSTPLATLPAASTPPLPPDTSVISEAHEPALLPTSAPIAAPRQPMHLSIPRLRIDSPVIPVGITSRGEMDVPSGNTNAVGWYQYGSIPGEVGSAVMDAHVYAAFRNLKNARVGDRVIVTDAAGAQHTFLVTASEVYPLAEVPMEAIVTKSDGTYLNFITCEGKYLPSRGTYDKRRVVYATLLE